MLYFVYLKGHCLCVIQRLSHLFTQYFMEEVKREISDQEQKTQA